jgi:iron(III) transport system substrate-binding protein
MKRIISLLLASALLVPFAASAAGQVVVYSARKEHLIKPLFDKYSEQTGVQIRYITDKEGPLLQRLKAEGKRTPADMLITVDAGNLWTAAEHGVLAELDSPVIEQNIPAHLRDPGKHWTGLSVRARTIAYSTERVQPGELSSYEDLADPKWKGRLCLRTSKKVYNQSLVATLIARHGVEQAEEIVKGWVANLATPPFSNDTKAMQAVAAGQCDVTVINTYYFGRLQKQEPGIKLALFWPNQDSSGVHVNVSGAGITRYAKHPKEARALLEWLSSEQAQGVFAAVNMEYPANPKVAADPMVRAWGDFKADQLNVAEAGRLQTEAIKLMDRAGYR